MLKEIYLAGGCFWGLEAYLKRLPGVVQTQTGYANGRTESPTYQDVCHRHTGHAETVKTVYQPEILSLALLLKAFFRVIDPTSENRQGWDIGEQYRTGIYYLEEGPAGNLAGGSAAAEKVRGVDRYPSGKIGELLSCRGLPSKLPREISGWILSYSSGRGGGIY